MKRLLIATCMCVLALVTGSASEAQSHEDFNGFYVGANAGGTFGMSAAKTTTVFSSTGYFATTSPGAIAIAGAQNISPRGFNGGGQIGYNYTGDHFMIGFEMDLESMSMNSSQTSTGVYPCCAPTSFTVVQSATSKWMATARPRVGFTHGRFLYYATVGFAIADLNYRETFTDTFATAHENGGVTRNIHGWTGGGGVEYALRRHWSVKGEYLYASFGQVAALSTNLTAFSGPVVSFPTNTFFHSADLRAHIVRGGVNFQF